LLEAKLNPLRVKERSTFVRALKIVIGFDKTLRGGKNLVRPRRKGTSESIMKKAS